MDSLLKKKVRLIFHVSTKIIYKLEVKGKSRRNNSFATDLSTSGFCSEWNQINIMNVSHEMLFVVSFNSAMFISFPGNGCLGQLDAQTTTCYGVIIFPFFCVASCIGENVFDWFFNLIDTFLLVDFLFLFSKKMIICQRIPLKPVSRRLILFYWFNMIIH